MLFVAKKPDARAAHMGLQQVPALYGAPVCSIQALSYAAKHLVALYST